jgi:hypothetical protein
LPRLNSECKCLTYKASSDTGLQSVDQDSELWNFVRSWSRKIQTASYREPGSSFERFIFLWVSLNAWASIAVPDQSRNHQDSYLIHALSHDPGLNSIFDKLYENASFRKQVDSLAALGPVFQTLWLRNKNQAPWQGEETETRTQYVQRVIGLDPFHRPPRGGEIPAFSPACALTHRGVDEGIPSDWPHILHMIYQVRCNLFHGGKSYQDAADQIFVNSAFKILWSVWQAILPLRDSGLLPWDRLFIRSGIVFQKVDRALLLAETDDNRKFIQRVLESIGWGNNLQGKRFEIPCDLTDEQEWFDTWQKCAGGAEAGQLGFENIELNIMDSYISGVIRWLNALGFNTLRSCDGHGKRHPNIILADSSQEPSLSDLLKLASNGRIMMRDSNLIEIGRSDRGGPRFPKPFQLLELAESLHSRWEIQRNDTSLSIRQPNGVV